MADPISAALTALDWSTTASTGPWTPIPHGRVINFTPNKEAKTYRSTSTAGQEKNLASASDTFDGSITVFFDSATPFDAGSLGIKSGVTGWVRVTDPASRIYVLPVYITTVPYSYNVEGDELVGATINFRNNGNIIYPS